jgi:hypothetical protein
MQQAGYMTLPSRKFKVVYPKISHHVISSSLHAFKEALHGSTFSLFPSKSIEQPCQRWFLSA